MASRRSETIDKHVAWIHREILNGKSSRILDLGCGPGFYSERLAALGHTCCGIDFSPASIERARQNTRSIGSCEYVLGDMRTAEFGTDYDLAAIIFGEFNAFPPSDAEIILGKMHVALKPGGRVLIEAHTYDAIKRIGQAENSWYRSESGLFSDRPHLCLIANIWYEDEELERTSFTVLDAETTDAEVYINTLQAYSFDSYRAMLKRAGFSQVDIIPAWGKPDFDENDNLVMLRARR